MADLARIKNNVARMVSMGAPESDIDGYIASEGVTIEDVRNYNNIQINPLTEKQKAKPKDTDYLGIVKAGLEGFGEGVEGGFNRAINTASFGAYDWLNRKFLGDQYGKQQRELEQRAESAGVGGLNTLANLLTDIGAGGATTGNVAYNLAGKVGLKGLGQLIGAGALEGGAWGATGSDTLEQVATNVPVSAVTGGVVGGGLGAIGNALKRFSPELSSVGLKTGLENALTDNNTIKALKRGAMNEDIANQLLSREAELKNTLNTRSADALEALTGQRFDVASAKQANRQAYKDYMIENSYKNIMPPKETSSSNVDNAEDFINNLKNRLKKSYGRDYSIYQGGNSGAGKGYSQAYGKSVNAIEAEENGLATAKDIVRELKKDKRFTNITEKDIIRNLRPSEWHHTGKNFKETNYYDVEDLLEYEFGKSKLEYLLLDANESKLKKNLINSLKEKGYSFSSAKNAAEAYKKEFKEELLPLNKKDIKDWVVNEFYNKYKNDIIEKKSLDELLNPSTEFQKESLSKALSEANKMTNAKEGTLAHTNEVKKALNYMIDSSMTQGSNMQMKPNAKTEQLMDLKSKLDDLLRQNSEIKNLDTEYSRLAKLDDAYQKGFNANPRSKVNLANDEQKTAFLKGASDNILSDVKTDNDLSRAIMNKQNILNKAMGKKEYQELMSKASDTSSQYDKLRSILNRARVTTGRYNDLVSPDKMRELSDAKYSAPLYALGKLINSVYGNTNRKVAQRIIDGLPIDEQSLLLEILARENPAVTGSFINQEILGRE